LLTTAPLIHCKSVVLGFFLAVSGTIQTVINDLAAIEDVNRDSGPVSHICRQLGNLADGVHTFDDLSKNDMLAVQVLALLKRDEELGRVGVWAAVGH